MRVIVHVYQFVCVCASLPFGFKGGTWELIVLVPDRCLSFYFLSAKYDLNDVN